jgi:REP element-mobilizing transposase RayT
MNHYNPQKHRRRSIRLQGYDYSQSGLYFITICCNNRICRFGHIENGEMVLNEFGTIAHDEWITLSDRFDCFELDVFQIMPNHIHAIISLNPFIGATLAVAQNIVVGPKDGGILNSDSDKISPCNRAEASPAPTTAMYDIVCAYKSLVANGCAKIYNSRNEIMGKLWQRNYYEHIIKNETSYYQISNYIMNNPAKWAEDRFYVE